ncbi:hypothetical protein D3C75_672420 [compost metagenome]
MYRAHSQVMVELHTSQFMCKDMVIMLADNRRILRKIRIIHKPDCRRNTHFSYFRDLFQMILGKHMQPVHNQNSSRRLAGGYFQHGFRRADDQFANQLPQRFCDSRINCLKSLWHIHQLERPACLHLWRVQAFHGFTQAEAVAFLITVAVIPWTHFSLF